MTGGFRRACESLLESLHGRGYKVEYLERNLAEFCEYAERRFPNAEELTEEIAEGWIYSKPEIASAQQMGKRVRSMRHLSAFLLAGGRDAYVPKRRFAAKKPTPPTLFTDEEARIFFETLDSWPAFPKGSPSIHAHDLTVMPVFFRLLYACGLRSGEAASLMRADADLGRGVIHIVGAKERRDRAVYPSESMLGLLRQYDARMERAIPGRALFFQRGPEAARMPKSYISEYFERVLYACGIGGRHPKNPTPHSLRHLFAVKSMAKCIAEGQDFGNWIKYLSAYMGHASPKETLYYLHVASANLTEMRGKVADLLEGEECADEDL